MTAAGAGAYQVAAAGREAARTAARTSHSATAAGLRSKRTMLQSAEARNQQAMQALLDAMHPRSRESLEKERQRQQTLAVANEEGGAASADSSSHINRMRAHMASHVALAKQARAKANEKKVRCYCCRRLSAQASSRFLGRSVYLNY